MFDEFGNYIGGSLGAGYRPSAFGMPIPPKNYGTIGSFMGMDNAPMQPLPKLTYNVPASPGNPMLTPQESAALGFNPNYGKSYSQPNPLAAPAASTVNPIVNPLSATTPPAASGFSPGLEQRMAAFLNRNITPPPPAVTTPPPAGGGDGGATDLVKKGLGLAGATNPYIAGATLALGGLSTIGGLIGLATTKEPEGYKLTPKLQRSITEAEQRAQFGLGAPQIALQRQMAREALNTQLMNTRNLSGGSLSRAALGSNVYASLLAGNQLAAQDYAAQQAKIAERDRAYQMEQAVADRNVALAQQQYAQKQAAYGGAMQQGLTNLGSYFNLQAALANKQTDNQLG